MSPSNRYKEEIDRLSNQLDAIGLRRASQVAESRNAQWFQDQATKLGDRIILLTENMDDLLRVDQAIDQASYAIEQHDTETEQRAHHWTLLAVVSGMVGGLLLLISSQWSPSAWMPIVAWLLIAGCVTSVVLSRQARRTVSDEAVLHGERLGKLRAKKRALLGEGPIQPASDQNSQGSVTWLSR